MYRRFRNSSFLILLLVITALLSACAEIHVNPVPAPPASPRLRVYVQPFTTFASSGKHWKPAWDTPHEEFVRNQVRIIEQYLAQTGIYEIVSTEEIRAAIGDQKLTRYKMERNDWALARKIGSALHADYVMVLERGATSMSNEKYFFNAVINVETGKKFGVQYSFERRGIRGQMNEIMKASYRDVFASAKEDLFSTAIRKAQTVSVTGGKTEPAFAEAKPKEDVPQPAQTPAAAVPPAEKSIEPRAEVPALAQAPIVTPPVEKQQELQASAPLQKEGAAGQPVVKKSAPSEDWMEEKDVEEVLTQEQAARPGTKLAVYDLDAVEQYRPAALILSESLREEIFKLRKFTLVDREDLDQVLKEMALQQTGLIDEKEAVKTGKGLAANQVVTGKMGLLGKTFVLQAKRINVETFATMGLASAKFSQGHEDDAFDKMREFAVKLTEGK